MIETATPILQFGTSRFLLAHADLFISEAMQAGEALGHVAIVQTTASPQSAGRITTLATGAAYPVRIRGLENGRIVDETLHGRAIGAALTAARDWAAIRRIAMTAKVILSNTGDRGFDLDPQDNAALAEDFSRVPNSFPAKLTALLFERWKTHPHLPVSIFPCELVSRNGDRLASLIRQLAADWKLPNGFAGYLERHCLFANSLVDRIVSEPIEPVGAIAEPYALWAIEEREGLVLPCRHPAIILTNDLQRFERLKLHILNLGHTYLAERWQQDGRDEAETVGQALKDGALRGDLENLWRKEVLPVFAADGLEAEAEAYMGQTMGRFLNPFLAHRLADIASNHAEKKQRRLAPVVARAGELGLTLPQTKLRAALARTGSL